MNEFQVKVWHGGKLVTCCRTMLFRARKMGLSIDTINSDTPYTPIYWGLQ